MAGVTVSRQFVPSAQIILLALGFALGASAASNCSVTDMVQAPITTTEVQFPNGGKGPLFPSYMFIERGYGKIYITVFYPSNKNSLGNPQTFSPSEANQLLNQLCPGLGIYIPASGKLGSLAPARGAAHPAQSTAAVTVSEYGVGSETSVFTDLNGDGNPDLAQVETSNNGGNVTVQLLGASGNVISSHQYPIGSTTLSLTDIVAADFNGDGFPDLAVGDDGGQVAPGAVWILLNNGDGTFKTAVKTTVTDGPYHLFAADFNGDGNIDIATANDQVSAEINVLFGKGDGTFQTPITLTGIKGAGSLVAADFYGTGRSDIAVLDYLANTIVVFNANANGSFQAPQSYPAGSGPGYLIYADLNNDGIPDLAAAYSFSNSVQFLINNGSGGFTPSPPYLAGSDPNSLAVLYLGGPFVLLSGDQITGNVLMEFAAGDGTLEAPQLRYMGQNPTALATGDVNGDGKGDAVVLEPGANAAYLLLNSGNGTFASPVTYSVPSPNAGALVTLTKGGKPDLVIASGTGNVEVLPNNGSGGFGAPLAFPAAANAAALAIADFNGDGNADVAVADGASATNAVSVLLGNGQGSLGTAATYLPGQFARAIAAADLNNDGHPDLIVASANPSGGGASGYAFSVTVLLNKGDGTFTALAPVYTLPASEFNGISQIVTGDFNGDGKMDVAVVQENQNSQIQILLGNGDGTLRTGALLTTEFGARTAVVADVNGDGHLDLVVGNCCGQTEDTFLLGNGDGTFQAEVAFPAGASPAGLALADWTGSGKLDLAIVGQILTNVPEGYFLAINNGFPPAVLSGASFAAGAIAPSEIVTLKGNLLASSTASAFPLPTTLGGATVTVTDSAGTSQAAPLYYASSTQINFEVPASVALGPGSVSLTQTDGTPVIAFVTFANSAPGIFQLNSSSLGAAEALVVNGGTQSYEQVYQLGAGNSVIPLPIDLSQGQVYLVLYGTGIRNAQNVTVSVGGQSVPVLFFGAQGTYAGEDQVNLGPLPASLAGQGSVSIVLTADGQTANTVNVTIK